MRFPDVPSKSIKLMLFPFSLEGSARIWLRERTSTINFDMDALDFDESFYECLDRFNDFFEHAQITEYSRNTASRFQCLNANDQDSLNSVAGGNVLDKMPRERLRELSESKSNVRKFTKQRHRCQSDRAHLPQIFPPNVAALTTEVLNLRIDERLYLSTRQKAQLPCP
ncbi:hypothetical protein Tco_1082323 [Tanacetum coccineum]|uniref:Retrotransposon gag domain-containing protein n=1 Tax=Tanacetum coccineum TaxID=301880 RepID=A0ABQ5I0B7_9ASTR